jgi:acyl-CoA synthetase (NDP forming)
MGLIAMTGGQSVVITDAFEREGLEVPLLTAASYEKLSSFFNIIGGSYRNPLDAGGTIGMGFAPGNLQKLLDILEEDENVDAIAMEVGASFIARRLRENPAILDMMANTLAAHKDRSAKPFLAIAHPGHVEDVMTTIRSKLIERGIAVFASFQAAARAQARAVTYHRQDLA